MPEQTKIGDVAVRILLTGGTGFFGKALLRHWLTEFQARKPIPRVTLLSRAPEKFQRQYPDIATLPGLQFLKCDITAPGTFPSSQHFTHVLHAAAESTLGLLLTPRQRFTQIVEGTRHVLDYALACGARRFLLTSSGAVYGSQPAELERVPEDWFGAPDSMNPSLCYGVAKRAAESLCSAYHAEFGLQIAVARCFAFVGPDLPLDVHFAIGNFIRDALWADSIQVNGDGSPVRSYLDQSDLAYWLCQLLMHATPGKAYNVGSDQPISIAELAHLVRDLIAPNKPVRILGKTAGDQPRNFYVPDIRKIQTELGATVRVSLPESIVRTAEAARARISQHGV